MPIFSNPVINDIHEEDDDDDDNDNGNGVAMQPCCVLHLMIPICTAGALFLKLKKLHALPHEQRKSLLFIFAGAHLCQSMKIFKKK